MTPNKLQKPELTWIGKGEEIKLEPRILIENPEYSYSDPNTEYNWQINGKPWRYALIPHDQVKMNMSLNYLIKTFEIKSN